MKNYEMTLRALQHELVIQQIFIFSILVALFFIANWIFYLAMKAAIRDGIKESGLVQDWKYYAKNADLNKDAKRKVHLPDMRAD
jgi:hypothetical protein